uniref:Transmembrane protein n=1 Tax=Panagrolaimus sp. PS1159 TaxID=55785 RepID=A0AC35FU05_9BILA
MFKCFSVFVIIVFAQIIFVDGQSCKVIYTGFGESEIPSYLNFIQKCDSDDISCISVNGTIHGNAFILSDCKNTAETILTNYLQGQYGYKTATSFDCETTINHYYNFNDGTIDYSYKCLNSIDDSPTTTTTTSRYQSTTTSDTSGLTCLLSTFILSIVYIIFN